MGAKRQKGKGNRARLPAAVASAPTQRFSAWYVALALAALTVAVYAGVWSYDFVQLDDPAYVIHNPHIPGGLTWDNVWWALTSRWQGYWIPLTWVSYMAEVQLAGVAPGVMHVTNVLLHVANTLLLFGLLRSMTGATGRSAFVAVLFAVHPLHVESVAWITERKDVLSTLFWMLTLWAYARYVRAADRSAVGATYRPDDAIRSADDTRRSADDTRRSADDTRRSADVRSADRTSVGGSYGAVLVLFALGLMAKPMLVTLPFVMLLLDVWPLGRLKNRGLLLEKLPLVALAALSSVATFVAQRGGGAVMALDAIPLPLRIENALVTYVGYIGKMCWPVGLVAYYSHPKAFAGWQVALAAAILIGVSVGVIRAVRRRPYLAVGWFWYLGTLVPVIGLVQAGRQAMADRFTYVPLIGLFMLAAWGVADLLARWPARRWVLPIAAAAVVLSCTIAGRAQVQDWRNDSALWTHAVRLELDRMNPHGPIDDRRVGLVVDDLLAEPVLTPLLGLLETDDPATAYRFLGTVFARHNQLDDAIVAFSEAIRLKPNLAETHGELGLALSRQGKEDAAIAEFTEALRLGPVAGPGLAEIHTNLGLSLANQGHVHDALPHFVEAVRLRPGLADAHRNLGVALAGEGRLDEAVKEFHEVLRLKPDDDNAKRALETLTKRGK